MEIKHFMLGNWVSVDCIPYAHPFRIANLTEKGVVIENENGRHQTICSYDVLNKIPLTDDFFKRNEFTFYDNSDGSQSILAKDNKGPATTRRMHDKGFPEYSITGIIVRSVDEWQNIMHVCGCSDIADSVVVKPHDYPNIYASRDIAD